MMVLDSDIEVLSLMLETLRLTGVSAVHIDLGHVGIFRTLAEQAGLTEEQERTLFDMLQRKAATEIAEFVGGLDVDDTLRLCLSELASLNGGLDTLQRAHEIMDSVKGLQALIDELKSFAEEISKLYPEIAVNLDLAELRGYAYHTGIVFAAYAPHQGKEIALGGRYDGIGQVFGQSRPATGFSTDLKTLLSLSDALPPSAETKIFAPSDDDEALIAVISSLRKDGQRVIRALKGQTADANAMGCTQQLVKHDDGWQLESL
jgi:ATP phosphoribosyltransferase regulatory subunit